MTNNFSFCFAAVLFLAGLAARAETPANPLDKAPSRFATCDGLKVHYKSLGAGEKALVFVHGWTCDMTSWRYQVPAFDGKVRMVLIDLPGHGKSDKPKIDYTMDVFAKAVDAVLVDAGVKKAVLAGHSMGTPVVKQFYRRYPDKVAGLIAVDGRLQAFRLPPDALKQFVARFEGQDYKTTASQFINGMMTKDTPEEVRKYLKATLPTAPQHVAVSAMKEMMSSPMQKDDPLKVPVQSIMAKNPFLNAEYEKYVRKLAPDVDYQLMEGVGHFLMMEKPKEFNALVLGFLKKNDIVK
jgi:pimeloyl-ACP methyl ester carboxylesterase